MFVKIKAIYLHILLQIFKDSYKFVDNLKDKELKTLKRELKVEEDPERKEQIKYLIQRMVSFRNDNNN